MDKEVDITDQKHNRDNCRYAYEEEVHLCDLDLNSFLLYFQRFSLFLNLSTHIYTSGRAALKRRFLVPLWPFY